MCIQMNGFYIASRRAPDYLSVGCGAIVRVVHFGESFMLPSVQVVSLANEQLVGDGADVL